MAIPNIPGQVRFGEIVKAVPRTFDPSERVNFSELATPEFWDLDPEPLAGIDTRMIKAIDAERIRPDILGIEGRPRPKNVVGGVALNDGEYELILRTPQSSVYGDVIEATSRERHRLMQPDRRQEVALEDRRKGFETKHDSMQTYLKGTLMPEAEVIKRAREAANYPGRDRRGDLVSRIEASTIKDIIFPNILDVVGIRRDWTEDQASLAARSLTASLFFFRSGNAHIGRWRRWLHLADDRNDAVQGLLSNRIVLAGREAG